MRKINRWAKHIISRFGRWDAYGFALSTNSCPCDYLNRSCLGCMYQKRPMEYYYCLNGCDYARDYIRISIRKRIRIKKKIIRMIQKTSDSL